MKRSPGGATKYYTLSLAEMILSSKEQQIHPENNTAFEKSALHWWCCHQNVHDCHGEDHDGRGMGFPCQQFHLSDRLEAVHLHQAQQDAPGHPGQHT